jgi:small-conductance mechanosensitive channel
MSELRLAFLATIGDLLRRLAIIFQVDGEALVRSGARVLTIWVLAWVALRLITLAALRMEQAVDDGDDSVTTLREKRGKTISQLLRSVGRVLVITLAVLLTLNVFVNIGPILAGAGILGLAVSFGAQSLVKDVISGFFILVENQFAIGDVVEAGGKSGVVERMTLRVVMLRDVEGTLHVVPNGEIKTVSNKTRGWSRAVVDVAIPYSEDVDRAIEIVQDEASNLARDEDWAPLLDGAPEVWGVEALTDNAAIVRMVARTQPGSNAGVAREFRRRIRKRLEEEGIGAPVQHRRVEVRLNGQNFSPEEAARTAAAAGAS